MDSEKMQTLFAQTLLGDYEDEEGWAAVSVLRLDGSREIFEYAAAWCRASEPLKRARAAAILCQLQRACLLDAPPASEWIFREESYQLITKMLEDEQNPLVLDSAICAIPIILPKLGEMLDRPKVSDRVGEAVEALLGLDQAPTDWTPADYKAAIEAKFDSED